MSPRVWSVTHFAEHFTGVEKRVEVLKGCVHLLTVVSRDHHAVIRQRLPELTRPAARTSSSETSAGTPEFARHPDQLDS